MIATITACLAAAVDQRVIDNAIDEWCADVFVNVWVQALDTLSSFCDNNNIHSAI